VTQPPGNRHFTLDCQREQDGSVGVEMEPEFTKTGQNMPNLQEVVS
jgi:hypothetical protein